VACKAYGINFSPIQACSYHRLLIKSWHGQRFCNYCRNSFV